MVMEHCEFCYLLFLTGHIFGAEYFLLLLTRLLTEK